jgi:hypothetical protein
MSAFFEPGPAGHEGRIPDAATQIRVGVRPDMRPSVGEAEAQSRGSGIHERQRIGLVRIACFSPVHLGTTSIDPSIVALVNLVLPSTVCAASAVLVALSHGGSSSRGVRRLLPVDPHP